MDSYIRCWYFTWMFLSRGGKMSNLTQSSAIEAALIRGDLSKLSSDEKLSYYKKVCESMGLNPLTQPFAYIVLNGKETLYAKRDATDQLRKVHKISINITARETIEGVYIVTARARDGSGREDESTGAVSINLLKGDALANAFLKAETKAKRRVTLSICGLGLLDETEVETIPTAKIEHQIEIMKEKQNGILLSEAIATGEAAARERLERSPAGSTKPKEQVKASPRDEPKVKKANSFAKIREERNVGSPAQQDLGDFEDSTLDALKEIKNVAPISMIEYGQLLALAATKKVTKEALDKRVKEKWGLTGASGVNHSQFEEMMSAFRG